MQLFINETSLNSQFEHSSNFYKALTVFVASIKKIADIKQKKDIFKSDQLFYYTGINGTHLQTTLKGNRVLNDAFVQNLQRINPKNWGAQKLHEDSSSYDFKEEPYVGTSVAELAERRHQDEALLGFLLNFSDSQFGEELTIDILKNNQNSISVDCVVTPESIDDWLIDNGFINPNEVYDVNSGQPPADYQTVLRDKEKFERTVYRNQNRIVYRKKGTNELWVVDRSLQHATASAHIEVFDEGTKKHLGTSLINEINLNRSHADGDKHINLN